MNNSVFRHYSVQQLDEQYNKRAEVPEHQEYFNRWKLDSEQVRQNHVVRENLAYGTGERETMDIFPAQQSDSPGVVFIHGGYWQALDKSYFSFIAPLLLRLGFAVVVLNYPLCPTVRLRDIVRSLRWAMIYLYRNVKQYNGNPEQFHLVGHSAGGHLAAMLMSTPWSEIDSSLRDGFVNKGVGISGVFELEPLRHTFINQALNLDQSEIDDLSPIYLFPPSIGAMDVMVGSEESAEFKRQSEQFALAWSKDEFVARCQVLENHNHFSILDEMLRPDGKILTSIVAAAK